MSLTIAPKTPPAVTSQRLVALFLSGRKETTKRTYRAGLRDFTAWTGAASVDDAARELLAHGHGAANGVMMEYRANLLERELAPETINSRLTAVRALVRLARMVGAVEWTIDVKGVKSTPYRNTKGPGANGYRQLLRHLAALPDTPKTRRDHAIIRLLYGLGLRRGEVASLDVRHVDAAAGTVSILGKGKLEREAIELPQAVRDALSAWMVVRKGAADAPLFVALSNNVTGTRLTGRGIAHIVGKLGQAVGLTVRPHGLRHAAITAVLEASNGNVRLACAFARHASPTTTMRYDDNRQNLAATAARLISEESFD